MSKRLLGLDDFIRLSQFVTYGSDVETRRLIDAYLDMMRVNSKRPGHQLDTTLAALRDLVAERCGVSDEVVQTSFEDMVRDERGHAPTADLTAPERDDDRVQSAMLDWYFYRARHEQPGSISLSETFEAGFNAGLSHHTKIEV